mgnify:CR=1 FL=1
MTSLSDLINCGGLGSCLQALYNLGVQIAVALAFLMIILGGFEYMLSATVAGKARGKERIMDALKGLIIIFISGSVLYYINPNIFNAVLTIPQINITGEPGQEPQSTETGVSPEGMCDSSGTVKCMRVKECVSGKTSAVYPKEEDISINPNVCQKLIDLGKEMEKNGIRIKVSAGKTRPYKGEKHESRCHNVYGTCIDFVPEGGNDRWIKAMQVLQNLGYAGSYYLEGTNDCSVFGAKTCNAKVKLCENYAKCFVEVEKVGCRPVFNFSNTTAPHIHLDFTQDILRCNE